MATAIDVGSGAISLATYFTNLNVTYIDLGNSANKSGIITSFEIYCEGWSGHVSIDAYLCAFHGSGTTYTAREETERIADYITSPAPPTKVTFTGLKLPIQEGDYVGIYVPSSGGTGQFNKANSGGSGSATYIGDGRSATKTYSIDSDGRLAFYGIGTTIEHPYSIVYEV